MDIENILKKLIRYDTTADKENGKIILWISDFLKSKSLRVEIFTDKKSGKSVLFASAGPEKNIGLYFVGHTDTVPAGDGWKYEPFSLTKKGDKLFGLGTSDMKGGIAAALSAIARIDPEKLKRGFGMVFTFDEEKTFGGIRYFSRKKEIRSGKIIIMEPTDGKPIVATKGVAAFRIEFLGRAAHGSVPDLGKNAIEMANAFIFKLQSFYGEIKKEKEAVFDPEFATLNIAKISGGDAINKVPARCVLEFEMRTIKGGQADEIVSQVKKILEEERLEATMEVLLKSDPIMNEKSEFSKMMERLAGKKLTSANYMTEASFLNENGNEAVIIGPGPVMAHKADEYVSKKSLEKMTDIYRKAIEQVCF